jgi:hypothetical protein
MADKNVRPTGIGSNTCGTFSRENDHPIPFNPN